MRIKLGFKGWSTLSAMLLALVLISGCNDEGTPPATNPTPPPPPPPPPAKTDTIKKPEPTPPPPVTKEEKTEEKHEVKTEEKPK